MSRFLLDTNVWIKLIKRRAPAVRAKLESLDPLRILTCSVVKGELWHGALRYENAEQRRAQVDAAMHPYASLPFDDAAAAEYARIRHVLEAEGRCIGPNDLLIAAICVANEVTLVTGNLDEFERVPGLRAEDWTVS